ncbi:hypothetical protein WKI68_43885 [Streptomyces sp. MS1.HAVA.3]|uniref:Uncharacterized protein n=1 Tax=Streptomyces caledonius TaxID=3134107 RepID=A0ABU8UG55_9ACTN
MLFEHGTCVVLTAPDGELAEQATEILKKFGPAHAGSSPGDFGVIDLKDAEGWVVTGHHNDVPSAGFGDRPLLHEPASTVQGRLAWRNGCHQRGRRWR